MTKEIIGNIGKYILKKEIYNEPNMKKYDYEYGVDTLCIKGAMGVGKTKQLHNLIPRYNKVVILSFRKTLDTEYVKKFKGFELYSNIEQPTIETDIYNKVVVQIDSFHRVMGKIDLLILDEFTYTAIHLVECARYREACYDTLIEYIKDIDIKIVVMDALLDTNIVKWFYYLGKNIKYIENIYEKHNDKEIYNYENKVGVFTNEIINNLKTNNKIVLSTNSKNYLNDLEIKIKISLPNIKYKFLTADNSNDIDVDNWNNYDIVGYTPTIVAGISYEEFHFDKSFGYFISSSSPAELSLQQLFRVRDISTKQLHICVENKDSNKYPNTMEELDKYITEKNTCLVNGVLGLKLSHINKTIKKDDYYYLYLNVQFKIFNSRNDYLNRLLKLLKKQGINKFIIVSEENKELDSQTRKDMLNTSKEGNIRLITDIVQSDDISDETYNLYKNKIKLDYKEKNCIKKKKYRTTYDYNDEIDPKDYKKYSKLYGQYKNINIYYTFKDNNIKDYIFSSIEELEKRKLNKIENIGNINERNKLSTTANTTILHSSKKYEKFLMGMEILYELGINDIFNESEVTVDKDKLIKYIDKREKVFRYLFNLKKIDIDEIQKDDKCLQILIKYINSRLKYLFNITLKCTNKKINLYKINGLDVWNMNYNPFKKNDDLLMDYNIKKILNDIF